MVAHALTLCCVEGWHCTSNPCQNGGECTSDLVAWYCDCGTGWTGLDCSLIDDSTVVTTPGTTNASTIRSVLTDTSPSASSSDDPFTGASSTIEHAITTVASTTIDITAETITSTTWSATTTVTRPSTASSTNRESDLEETSVGISRSTAPSTITETAPEPTSNASVQTPSGQADVNSTRDLQDGINVTFPKLSVGDNELDEYYTISDHRTSAKVFGSLAIFILIALIGIIVISDIVTARKHVKRLGCMTNIRNARRMTARELCYSCWCANDRRVKVKTTKRGPKLSFILSKYRERLGSKEGDLTCDKMFIIIVKVFYAELRQMCCAVNKVGVIPGLDDLDKLETAITAAINKDTADVVPSTSGIGPSTSDVVPSTSGIEPSTSGIGPSTSVPSTSDGGPSTSDVVPSTSGIEPSTSGIGPSTSVPSTSDGVPSTSNVFPCTSNVFPCISGEFPSASDVFPSTPDVFPTTSDDVPNAPDVDPSTSGMSGVVPST
ncbi:unnamed protein product [Owenia fusiformis]|uniref:Uncharacterized protein n=1 Tax=Owenia fusiformis TaxID=6347 RepID=A0A8J1UYW5_OWEFU|nr:unnamed protein product [Owenia fusiformis]